jgi:hypothetical protein
MMIKKHGKQAANAKSTNTKPANNQVTAKPLAQSLVQKLEVETWRSEIQQIVRTKDMSWASCFYLQGIPFDKSSEVTLCRIGFYSDERSMKPSYANNEIRIYYPYSAYQDVLSLLIHAKKLHVEFKEKPNGEIDAFLSSHEQAPGGKKLKK